MNDLERYKSLLIQERAVLEQELNELGVRTEKDGTLHWEVGASSGDILTADESELADQAEEVHIDTIVKDELEARHRLIQHAYKKIEDGSYGICEIGSEPIEDDRLHANPAARTCKAHMEKEDTLPL